MASTPLHSEPSLALFSPNSRVSPGCAGSGPTPCCAHPPGGGGSLPGINPSPCSPPHRDLQHLCSPAALLQPDPPRADRPTFSYFCKNKNDSGQIPQAACGRNIAAPHFVPSRKYCTGGCSWMSYLGGITPGIQGLRITGVGSVLLDWTRHTWASQHAPRTRGGLNK